MNQLPSQHGDATTRCLDLTFRAGVPVAGLCQIQPSWRTSSWLNGAIPQFGQRVPVHCETIAYAQISCQDENPISSARSR
jgi:hypothetical protein